MKIVTRYLSSLLTEFHNVIAIENVLKQFFQVNQLSDKSVERSLVTSFLLSSLLLLLLLLLL